MRITVYFLALFTYGGATSAHEAFPQNKALSLCNQSIERLKREVQYLENYQTSLRTHTFSSGKHSAALAPTSFTQESVDESRVRIQLAEDQVRRLCALLEAE